MATAPDPIRNQLERLFPGLAAHPYAVRGPADNRYNCIAWIAHDTDNWWWPDSVSFWPTRARTNSLAVFSAALATLGFAPCDSPTFHPAFEKIAIYSQNGLITHAARIESDNLWSSKLGRLELVQHHPNALNDSDYGHPTHFYQRSFLPTP